MIKTEKQDR
ncbi:Hypothetical protein SSCIU_02062 [Mammaliicoccus sciuri]|nr:Hypothetical protein SSCIU_02062 [Mammaliicoccus sciuri]